ncbi:hypothetical protein AVEN_243738-1 [Araneus ventricosus]|uniref:Uncharacterized protein n=1 Tax=Araneus ventricosus TaxID=182803 RepID=A0A4Y2A6A4_ARAVE|nr:hypothetical protein AVEN_243738-1 [Araneus ventricosus]
MENLPYNVQLGIALLEQRTGACLHPWSNYSYDNSHDVPDRCQTIGYMRKGCPLAEYHVIQNHDVGYGSECSSLISAAMALSLLSHPTIIPHNQYHPHTHERNHYSSRNKSDISL